MSKKAFDDFLRKEEEKRTPAFDWDAEKKWWLNQVDNLYADIQNWLKEYIDSKKISIEFSNIDIYEEVLGVYSARQMSIKINDKFATLTPVGTVLIGTKGRVDMTGSVGAIRFILADRNAKGLKIEAKKDNQTQTDWVWKITTDPPRIEYKDLTQDTFFNCLIQVCNG
jgi:hypothetical protein